MENTNISEKKDSLRVWRSVQKYTGIVLKYIALAVFAAIIILPVAWVIMSAFKTSAEIQESPFKFPKVWQFSNFASAWTGSNMGLYFVNSIILTVGSLIILLVLAVPAAYVLSRFKYKFLSVFFIVFMAGLFVNMNYIVMPLYVMIFSISRGLGLGASLVDNHFTVMLIYAITNIAFTIYLLCGYFKGLPGDFEEAAKIDGCGYWGTLIRIVVPLSMPSILTVVMFNFLAFWNEYLVAITFLSAEKRTLPAGLLNIMRQDKVATDYGRMYAGLVIVIIPVIILYSFVQGQLTKGMTMGGVKG